MEAMENNTTQQSTGLEYTYLVVHQQGEDILVRSFYDGNDTKYQGLQNQKRVEGYPQRSSIKELGEPLEDNNKMQKIIDEDRRLSQIPEEIKDIAYTQKTITKFHNLINFYNEQEQVQIKKGYELMLHAHKNQTRDEGTPYIYHPLTIATRMMQDGATYKEVIIALLHDVIEDNETINIQYINDIFGDEIAEGVQLLSKKGLSEQQYKENIQKKDSILKIKAYDRRHNTASLLFQPDKEKKKQYIQKTIDDLLPIFKERIPMQADKIESILSYIQKQEDIPDIIKERRLANQQITKLKKKL